jgi:hypothetical protein
MRPMQVITELKNRGVQDIFIACVDGLKGFPEVKFPDGKDFKLTGLKVFTELNKKSFSEISDGL